MLCNDPFYPGRVYHDYDGTQLLFEHYCFPQGVNSFSNQPAYDMRTQYGWGADGIGETYVTSDYESAYNGTIYYYLAVLNQAVGYMCDPMGNVASHVYDFGSGTDTDYAFYGAFGLLTGYVGQVEVPTSLWYKGQSGAETAWFGGTNFGPMGPSDPLSYFPGLILMGYRWYNPSLGRFWTRDPQGYAGGINLYAFCRNNPLNHSDPLGLDDGLFSWHTLGDILAGTAGGIITGGNPLGVAGGVALFEGLYSGAEGKSLKQYTKDAVVAGVVTYAGGRVLGAIGKTPIARKVGANITARITVPVVNRLSQSLSRPLWQLRVRKFITSVFGRSPDLRNREVKDLRTLSSKELNSAIGSEQRQIINA